MKRTAAQKVLPIFFGILLAGFAQGQSDYRVQVQAYRDSVNRVFADTATSILHDTAVARFQGLHYWAVDEHYRVTARFKKIRDAEARAMKTSGQRTPLYKPYGTLRFMLSGEKCVLTLYQSADPQRPHLGNYLLLAFTDLTTGAESYGGGRYLEYTTADVSGKMTVDFNYAFNPYCAYSAGYSCVIPPPENFLGVRVEAGVKKFHD